MDYNEILRGQLADYKDRNKLTDADLGRELGFGATRINKYLNLFKDGHVPEPDVDEIEKRAADVLKGAERRQANRVRLFPTAITGKIGRYLEDIRRTNDVGLVSGPAGVGKTCAAELYAADNPTAVLLTVLCWKRNSQAMTRLLFDAVDHATCPSNKSHADWLEEWFKGSNRLLIVDNAHKLGLTGVEYLFDFHDTTGVPIALIGNPEVLKTIRRSDQWTSRIGLCREVKMDPKTADAIAGGLATQLTPDSGKELLGEAVSVTNNAGHARALKKQLVLCREMNGSDGWLKTFKAAGLLLLKPA